MIDKFIFSCTQSPELLRNFFSDTTTIVEKYALSQEDVRLLKEMFSGGENIDQLSQELTVVAFMGWWPP